VPSVTIGFRFLIPARIAEVDSMPEAVKAVENEEEEIFKEFHILFDSAFGQMKSQF